MKLILIVIGVFLCIKVLIYVFVFFIAGLGMNQVISDERYDCDCSSDQFIIEFIKFRRNNKEIVVGEIKEEVESGYDYLTQYLLNDSIIFDVSASTAKYATDTNTIMLGAFHKLDDYENKIEKGSKEYFLFRKKFEREFIDNLGVECIRR